ncbi:MAG: hypothetical protein V3T83_07880, partial [Acidobacteriota bacterium]
MALMAGIVYGALRIASNTFARSQDRMERQARERVLKDFMRRQLGSLFPLRPSGSFLPEEGEALESEEPVDSLALSQSPLFEGTSRTVTFITVAPFMHLRNPGLTVVTYGRARYDESGQEYLGAMETRFVDVNSFFYMAGTPSGKPLPIVDGVQDVRFQYYGYNPDSDSFEWFDEWSGELTGTVPSAVRVEYDDQQMTVTINATDLGQRQAINQALRRSRNLGGIAPIGRRR